MGAGASVSNTQCTLNSPEVTEPPTVNGNDLTVVFPVEFDASFEGNKSVYLRADDLSGSTSNWDLMGTWTVTALDPIPVPLSISPNSGGGTSATFTASYVDGNGAADIDQTYVRLHKVLIWGGSCAMRYDRPTNLVHLINDAGNDLGAGQTPGTATTLSNSTCSLDVSGVTVDQAGSILTVTYPLTFTTTISSTRNIFMSVNDSTGADSGYQQMGTWDFPGSTPNVAPVNTAVSPSSGSGGSQTFTVTVSDANGEQDIAHTQLTINDTQDLANACSIFYNRLANWVALYNDAGTAWTNATLGSAVTLSNSFCSLEVAGVRETTAVNDLMVSFPIVFSGAVLGAQNIYQLTRDRSGYESGWDSVGTWTVTAAANTPAADSQTIITNSQSSVVITLTSSDPAGEDLTFSIPNPPDPGAPTKGTLSGLTPIVPAPIPHREPPPATVQPPVMSATVTYTPNNPGANEEDSFAFTVTNPGGLAGSAVVEINPLDTSPPFPPLSSVDATDISVETTTDTATAVRLSAGGPDTVTEDVR